MLKMFVYTNIGLSPKINELKISNSDHLYNRPVLLYAQKIINFAQRQLGDCCHLMFVYTNIGHNALRRNLFEYTNIHNSATKLSHFLKTFPKSKHYCYILSPTPATKFWLHPHTLSFINARESKRSANAIFGCFRGRPPKLQVRARTSRDTR